MPGSHLGRYGRFPEGIHAIEVGDVAWDPARRFEAVVPHEPDASKLGVYPDAADVLAEHKSELVDDMYDYATSEYDHLEWDEELSQRDGENIIESLRLSLKNGRTAECRHFVLGFFVYHPQGTEPVQQVVPGEALEAFVSTWRYLKDRISDKFAEEELAERAGAEDMVDALIETVIVGTLEDPRTVPIIEAEIAPNAKPERSTAEVGSDWHVLVRAPFYYVPGSGFATGYELQHGAAELSSPVLITNNTPDEVRSHLRVVDIHGSQRRVASDIPVRPYDVLLVPLNGQFIHSGERLEARTNADDGVVMTVSYTVGEIEVEQVDEVGGGSV